MNSHHMHIKKKGTRSQRGFKRNGKSRPAHHAHWSAHHTRHAHAGPSHTLGGRGAQILAQTLYQVAFT